MSDDKLRLENPLKQAANSQAAQIYRAEFVVNRRLPSTSVASALTHGANNGLDADKTVASFAARLKDAVDLDSV